MYQNEVSLDIGMTDEEDAWLGNFGDNVLEYFTQYNVKHLKSYVDFLPERISYLQTDIANLQSKLSGLTPGGDEYEKMQERIKQKQNTLKNAEADQKKYTAEAFNSLSRSRKKYSP